MAGQRGPNAARRVIAFDVDRADAAYGWRSGAAICIDVPDVAVFRARRDATVVTAAPYAGADPGAVLDSFFDTALPFAVQATRDVEVVHGSGVIVAPGGMVAAFCGRTEVGKSTVAYGLALRGHGLWADDAVAFKAADGLLRTFALPFSPKLREASAAHFGAAGDGEELPSFEGRSAPLGWVFLLEPVDADAAEALAALLPNAFRFRPAATERRRQTLVTYLELVASVPVWKVRYPHDIDRLPELLDLLEERMVLG
jgi:hypothetical protein